MTNFTVQIIDVLMKNIYVMELMIVEIIPMKYIVKIVFQYVKGCQEDEILCDTKLCIPDKKICDKIADCKDGKDERNCYEGM